MSKRKPDVLLEDILEAAKKIKAYTKGYREEDIKKILQELRPRKK